MTDIQHGPDELHHDAWPGFARAFYVVAAALIVYLVFIIFMSTGGGGH